ncbi:hypothetical protein A8C32_05640 [Flavivirga aquatica]|uniref:Carbohydrate-binding protein SusD n=1 Tax=Flavivirga aquatica TaxID=1849968 RepID=A0A1E5SHU5_9FLAO|nr:RagB/SusD family nutrient uptake outer membrane protein [Flavivirga aquatica]OEJ98680.1 hypothetical protein A8C32_05640 [Flavivirga aquatica]
MERLNKKTSLVKHHMFANKIIILLLIFVVIQSCEKDFLEQTNPNALTTGDFWNNNTDLNFGLNATYSVIKDKDIIAIRDEAVRTDIATHQRWRAKSLSDAMYDQNFDGTTKYVQNKWNALFLGVFRANQVIENYERLKSGYSNEDAEEEGLRIVAQARALRGYFYYMLSTSYNGGSVPLLTSIPKTFAEFQQAFSTAEAVKEFYRADLTFSLENLPETYTAWEKEDGNNLGRITGGACEALLGKSYIVDNNFAEAEVYLKNVIDNYNYELVDDLAKNFTGIAEFNSESIFELNFTTSVNLDAVGEEILAQDVTHLIYGAGIQPSSWITLKYREEKPDANDPANMNIGANVYDDQGEVVGTIDRLRRYSLRMANSMGSVDDIDSPMYGVPQGTFGDGDGIAYARNRLNVFKKFTHWNTIGAGAGEDKSTDFNNKSDINIPVIRLADIYLLYAECMLEKGDLSEALRYINRVRKRSHLYLLGKSSDPGAEFLNAETTYIDDINLDINGGEVVTITNLMEHLRFTERPLELALEGERSTHLRRWGVFKQQLMKLASIKYDYWTVPPNFNGKHAKPRYKCFLTRAGETPEHFTLPENQRTREKIGAQDAIIGSGKFSESLHAYLPIPQNEIDANLNWDVIKD